MTDQRSAVRWTDDDIAVIKAAWIQGKSANEISKMFKGRTRNSVISVIHRNGIQHCGRAALPQQANRPPELRIARTRTHPPKPGPQNKPAVIHGRLLMEQSTSTSTAEIRAERAAEGHRAIARASAADVASPNALPFLQAKVGCKWPIGEGMAMMSCCNPIVRGVYCEGHATVAFAAIQPQLRQGRPVQMKKFAAAMAKRDGVEPVLIIPAANDGLWDVIRDAA